MLIREHVRAAFADGDRWFHDSPLYRVLARVVRDDATLLRLAGETPEGPQPANMLMAATHATVLRDPSLPFARFFATVVGEDEVEPPGGAAGEYPAFCAEHRDAIAQLLRTRLVQTNEPARATALRCALHEIARRVDGPVTLLEVGASAGIQLRFDRWAVHTFPPSRRFGPADAPLTIRTEWRGTDPVPDLDRIPAIGMRLGVDLHPVDASDADERRWLQALVWPEHTDRFATLGRALDAVAADPPEILAGDAIELLPRLDADRLPTDAPLVVFHSQVRMHVPARRRLAFDAAIGALGARRRLLHVSLEHRDDGPGAVLSLQDSAGGDVRLARVHGHGRWITAGADAAGA